MKLNARELGTVLAALRYWQATRKSEGGLWDSDTFEPIASDNGLQEPLDAGEIDELCERINMGDRTEGEGLKEIIDFLDVLLANNPNEALDLLTNEGEDILNKAREHYRKSQ